jgi:hypothetical protein
MLTELIELNVFVRSEEKYIRIALVDGQDFSIRGGGGSGDDYSFWEDQFVRDGDMVVFIKTEWWCDKDGPQEATTPYHCHKDKIACKPVPWDGVEIMMPDWEVVSLYRSEV